MSLIDDALKRQEELRRNESLPGAGASRPAPPDETEIFPDRGTSRSAAPSIRVRSAPPPREAPPRAPARPPTRPPRGPVRTPSAFPENPFLERERALSRRRAAPVFLMPLLGLLIFLVLLFLRREFIVPAPDVPTDDPSVFYTCTDEAALAYTDEAAFADLFPAATNGPPPAAAAVPAEQPDQEAPAATNGPPPAAVPAEQPRQEAPAATNGPPPAAVPAERPEQEAPAWPPFTLTGIAVGRERLAILDTGEMLTAGERSKCGAVVEAVNVSTVVFSWKGGRKTLRKGESSDKPADTP